MGTTVNGVAAFTIPATFAGRVEVDLKGGNDTATVTSLPANNTGFESENTETVSMSGTTVGGKLKVEDVSSLTLRARL